MNGLDAPGFPAEQIRARARTGAPAVFPPTSGYGRVVYGASGPPSDDPLDAIRLVPPVFVPGRLAKLTELGREPMPGDVDLAVPLGGFTAPLPLYISAFGSTRVAAADLGLAASRQAARLGVPLVIGENIVATNGYGRLAGEANHGLLRRITAYAAQVPDGVGGVVIQQSTEDADAEVWNLVYSDPGARPLLDSGRLGFELKVGQGAKPGLGGMTLVDEATAARLSDQYTTSDILGDGHVLRCSSPGTFTEEILRQQIRFMRNNYPRARVWVKLHPGRDVADAAKVAWGAGADSVTVDGAEGGTGWAPPVFLDNVGLPLDQCLRRIGRPDGCLLVSGRMWEGARVAKCLALGASGAGLGRAALVAVAEDPEHGLERLAECLAWELRLLISALGKYAVRDLGPEDIWRPEEGAS